MAVNLPPIGKLLPVPGVEIGTAAANIKYAGRDDLALFSFREGTEVAGVFTQSHFAAAPVLVCRQQSEAIRGWLINSGNANAATGNPGHDDALALCQRVASQLGVKSEQIQPFSTGVIGERLPVQRMGDAISALTLKPDGWLAAAKAIMTTDTQPKGLSRQVTIRGETITLTGIAKGSGMIKPNMATMLAYIACDAQVTNAVCEQLVQHSVDQSFNRITVDGDTSTNDCFMLACTGASGVSAEFEELAPALTEMSQELAQLLVRDGEGATKFVTVKVQSAKNSDDALAVAYTVAESPLVKTALFAGDANWGRFCMAIGRAPVSDLAADRVSLWLDEVQVAQGGLMCDSYTEDAGAAVLAQSEFTVLIDLGLGDAAETVWTTDLSYDYVRINAEYRT